ncbi:MAG: hypothetical protein IPL92_10395 [Saprospiraceae bacterium]|nr:hypothetical protein [Candidatus Opimibacter iunctus]
MIKSHKVDSKALGEHPILCEITLKPGRLISQDAFHCSTFLELDDDVTQAMVKFLRIQA